MGWELRLFFALDGVSAPFDVFSMSTVRGGGLLAGGDDRDDLYIALNDPALGLKIRNFDRSKNKMKFELKIRLGLDKNGGERWSKVVADKVACVCTHTPTQGLAPSNCSR